MLLRRATARKPLLPAREQKQLRCIGGGRQLARPPGIIVQIHVGVVLDMTAEWAVEIPEPVGTKQVPTRPPECLITLRFEAGTGQQYLGPAPHVEGEVLDAFHERRSLDEEQCVMVICS